MRVHWHRRDLRASDNHGLVAGSSEPILPVFVFSDSILAHAAPPRVAFLLEALASLRDWYRDHGSELIVETGDPQVLIPRLADEVGADTVSINRDYSGVARERDASVSDALDGRGIPPEFFHDAVCHEPGTIRTNAGDPYSVYTYFWQKWRDREKDAPYATPASEHLADRTGEPLPTLDDLGFAEPEATIPPAGTDPATARLEEFLDDAVFRYADQRDYPAAACTSGLSPHLKFGTIGIRTVDTRVRETRDDVTGDKRESVVEFRSQLAWREFYTQVLYFNPNVVTENYREYANPIDWREDPEALQAWKDGRTGYPIIDAGMRQLREEAVMHNRVRMLVASFLTKDLQLDWRKGYAWFREKLVDHDTANDTGGWQWAASTGTDAQPYFRIFNPITQQERYDPDAEYIQDYIPELADVPPTVIHDWPALEPETRASHAPDYPPPIVDHDARREETLAMFQRARGEE